MAALFQSANLVASPSYPNSISWSEENLIAVASGHLITILNPASLTGPRGLITLPTHKPFPIGVVKREDLLAPCIMPISLSRDIRPCARSLSWSPTGFSPNSGCLLAVCTAEGRVKLYRSPYCEYCAEWIEVMDVSDLLYHHLESINFGELAVPSAMSYQGQASASCIKESEQIVEFQGSLYREVPKRRKTNKLASRIDVDEQRKSQGQELRCNDSSDDSPGAIQWNRNSVSEASKASENRRTRTGRALNFCSISKQGSSAMVVDTGSKKAMVDSNSSQSSSPRSIGNLMATRRENQALPLISADRYAFRSSLLSSLIVAWSPALQLPGEIPSDCFSSNCAILAVGGKSGNISFWRFCEPQCYTIEHGSVSVDVKFIGILQAHNSWITAISWGVSGASSSEPCIVLATGSSDGSLKVWLAGIGGLIRSTGISGDSFSLFKEVIPATSIPISSISLAVPAQSLDKAVLAVGKGSGSLEAWICHISNGKVEEAGVCNAHDQVVTGLAWAFAGSCLYSCSQDNTLRSWVLNGSCLYEAPFPNSPGLGNATSPSQVSDQCFGLALSSGEVMIAVVRSNDVNLLNQMYQARTQKAVVEFFWIGGQPLEIPSNKHLDCNLSVFSGLSETDLACWESNILWSLKCCDDVHKVLVLWDIVAALLAFKISAPTFVENILVKWISSWFSDFQYDLKIEKVLSYAENMLSAISSRKIHILNIICRRLMLTEVKGAVSNGEQYMSNGMTGDKRMSSIWDGLLINSERELQERLVAFAFRTVLNCLSCSQTVASISTSWLAVGVAQMKQWVGSNPEMIQNQLKLLGSKVRELESRIHSICEYEMEERCGFCSAPVPFESPEVAWCEGTKSQDGTTERHRLTRCAISMQLADITTPMWFCMCCQRSCTKLAPRTLFTMSKSPLDLESDTEIFTLQERSKPLPLCLFCGILLQRLLPEFLLSSSPV